MPATNKVLLIYCGTKSKLPRIPYGLLELASFIRDKGYKPEILDARIQDYLSFNPSNYLCIGLSCMTGAGLKIAMEISQYSKSKNKSIPVIWGGNHVSAEPQSITEPFIDAIVVGEGEKAFIKILKEIQSNKFKGGIYEQELIDMNELGLPAYDLINLNRYLDRNDLSYSPTRGCPHKCIFCYVENFHKRKWRSKSVKKTVEEIHEIVNKYNPGKLKFDIGDNFFANKQYALDVCKGITDLNIKWASTCRVDYLAAFTEEEMKIIKDSGCWALQLGCESGNQEILNYIQKGITPEQSKIAVKKCVAHGILATVNFVIGFPNETKRQRMDTLDLYDTLANLGGSMIGIFVLYPFAGTKFYRDAIKLGYKPPANINEWVNIELKREKLPWHGKIAGELQTISTISRFKYFITQIKYMPKRDIENKIGLPMWAVSFGIIPFKISAALRWKYRFFKGGYEWLLFKIILKHFVDVS